MPGGSPGSLRSTFGAHVGSVLLDISELRPPRGAKVRSGAAKTAPRPPKVTSRAAIAPIFNQKLKTVPGSRNRAHTVTRIWRVFLFSRTQLRGSGWGILATSSAEFAFDRGRGSTQLKTHGDDLRVRLAFLSSSPPANTTRARNPGPAECAKRLNSMIFIHICSCFIENP